jgi:hypothetical protein
LNGSPTMPTPSLSPDWYGIFTVPIMLLAVVPVTPQAPE